jgi:hypothetical protein
MIIAIVKMQGCTTRPGRRAFVAKDQPAHGTAKGPIREYKVTGRNWPAIRQAVAGYDTTERRTINFSGVGPDTVLRWHETPEKVTETTVRPVRFMHREDREAAAGLGGAANA